jgi:hypothetical protein
VKLREFNFNSLKHPFALTTLCVKDEDKSYEGQSVGETLRMLPLQLVLCLDRCFNGSFLW